MQVEYELFYPIYRKGIQMAHWGACTNLTSPEKCHTLKPCPEEESSDEPVCGSDSNVYR